MKEPIAVSIVVPIYNEEDSVEPLYESIRQVCDSLPRAYEIVFVDDGSRDRSYELLKELHARDPRVKVVRFRKNYGQTAAMAAGFRAARGEIVISMDGDLQNDPCDIPRLINKLEEGYDVVCGWRKDRKDKLVSRKIPSRIANWLIGKITGVPIHDNGCSLKAYKKAVIKHVALYSELHRFIPAMSTLTGARIAEIVVHHHPRRFGQSKYGISRAWRVLSDLFLIKMLTGFSSRPALWFGIVSVPPILLGMSCVGWFVTWDGASVIFPTIAFLCFCLAGHLVMLGIIGEFIVQTSLYRPAHLISHSTGIGDRKKFLP
ncbi:MAG: glycosyltransferase [Nitrospirae bacterium]|nr:MAG: glycosyltransferase [Nitrospirota bacterium]